MSREMLGYKVWQGFVPHLDGVLEEVPYLTSYELKRRGNVVFGKLHFSCNANLYESIDIEPSLPLCTLPENFRPKEAIEIECAVGYLYVPDNAPSLLKYDHIKFTIGTDGTIVPNIAGSIVEFIIYFGFETPEMIGG